MNKAELISAVADKSGLSKKDAGKAVDATLEAITGAVVAEDKVTLIGFGTFETRHRAARTGRNPRSNSEIQIPASKLPVFKAGKPFKDSVSGK